MQSHFLCSLLLILVCAGVLFGPAEVRAQTLYNHGDPTDLEQFMLEQVNRARRNPQAEADRYGIDFYDSNEWNDLIDLTPKQPLAFNPMLLTAARAHTQWMFSAKTVSHQGPGNSDGASRMIAAGYPSGGDFLAWGENIAWNDVITGQVSAEQAAAASHRTLFVSEGSTHRFWMLDPTFQEAGIGTIQNQMPLFGPNRPLLLTTEKYASSPVSPSPTTAGAFLVGVVYNDLNSNQQYNPGEGLGNVEVRPSAGGHYAVTSSSGGYAIPMGLHTGSVTITFNGNGVTNHRTTASIALRTNLKVDLRLQDAQPSLPEINAWLQSFVGGGLSTAELAYEMDPDGDQWNNLLEYVFGGHPGEKDTNTRAIEATPATATSPPTLTYWLSENSQTLTLSLRCSTDLQTWTTVAESAPNTPFTPTNTAAFSLKETIANGKRRLDVTLKNPAEPCYYQIRIVPE